MDIYVEGNLPSLSDAVTIEILPYYETIVQAGPGKAANVWQYKNICILYRTEKLLNIDE